MIRNPNTYHSLRETFKEDIVSLSTTRGRFANTESYPLVFPDYRKPTSTKNKDMDDFEDNPKPYKEHFTPKRIAHLHHVKPPADLCDEADAERIAPPDENEKVHSMVMPPERAPGASEFPDVYEGESKAAAPPHRDLPATFSTITCPDPWIGRQPTALYSDAQDLTNPAKPEVQELHISASVDVHVRTNSNDSVDVSQQFHHHGPFGSSNFATGVEATGRNKQQLAYGNAPQENASGEEQRKNYETWTERDLD